MKKQAKHLFALLGTMICSLSFLAGCTNNKEKSSERTEEEREAMVTYVLENSSPITQVHIGEYESMITGDTEELPEDIKTATVSTIFDMPRNGAINLVYDIDKMQNLQSPAMTLQNIVEANDAIKVISITDRAGEFQKNLLTSDGEKITVSAPGGFEYGEVYQIELGQEVPYLNFEGKNADIRKLTLEIEDDPSEAATYNDVSLKSSLITNIDRTCIKNKKEIGDNRYTFDYYGDFPKFLAGDRFYATKLGKKDDKLDFYGVFLEQEINEDGSSRIEYRAPNMTEIYDSLRLKGQEEMDISNAECLLTDELVLNYFKESSLGKGLARTFLEITEEDVELIIKILSHITIHMDVAWKNNRLCYKITLDLHNFKAKEGLYLGLEVGYECIKQYTMDFNVKIHYSWIFPTGLDYKLKCIEDTQEAYFIKFYADKRMMDEIPDDTTYCEKLMNNMEKSASGKSSELDILRHGDQMNPSTGGTRTTWPLLIVDINYFAPLQIRIKLDFYVDFGLNVVGLAKYETRSTKVDFCWTNYDGSGEDSYTSTEEGSNVLLYFAGTLHLELGLRLSFGVSLFGLYDFLHAEVYAEAYISVSLSGMIGMNLKFSSINPVEFSGYICIDFGIVLGVRAGIHLKALFLEGNFSKGLSWYLVRFKWENSLEHWSEEAETEINLNKETMSFDETEVLRIRTFDSLSWTMREEKIKASETFAVASGLLIDDNAKQRFSGHVFEYKTASPYLTVSDDGVIHVKDGTPNTFDAVITVHIDKFCGFISDRDITVHYTASDIQDIYCDDVLIGQARPTTSFTLPEAPKIYGKAFDYYEFPGRDYQYQPGSIIIVGNETIRLVSHYHDLPKYKVYFIDPERHLLATDEVYEGYPACAPFPAMRDRYMGEEWMFLSWDKPFNKVMQPTLVYAIYTKVN